VSRKKTKANLLPKEDPIFEAIRTARGLSGSEPEEVTLVKQLLEEAPERVHLRACGGLSQDTPLHLAVVWGQFPRVLQLLLDAGADPNAIGESGETPLGAVFRHTWEPEDEDDMFRTLEILLRHGADPNLKTKGGTSACQWVRRIKHERFARLLEQYGGTQRGRIVEQNQHKGGSRVRRRN
jgi:hypothetical protein